MREQVGIGGVVAALSVTRLTQRLRLPEAVGRAVLDGFERFDGRGAPAGRAGAEVAEAARFAAVG